MATKAIGFLTLIKIMMALFLSVNVIEMAEAAPMTQPVQQLVPHSTPQLVGSTRAGLAPAIEPVVSVDASTTSPEKFNFFSDAPVTDVSVVKLPPEKPLWMTVGGPLALFGFFFMMCLLLRWFIPFREPNVEFSLQDLPVAAQRGIGMAAVLFGIAFFFGLAEVQYQVNLNGSTEAYFANMSRGKLIAFTHAHLFGFTTAFFIIGIPFSMHFNRLKVYQWVFPAGLAAALTDIISWWGIKYVSANFDYVTLWCGAVYGTTYLWMLVGVIRIMFFPNMRWLPDFINEQRPKL